MFHFHAGGSLIKMQGTAGIPFFRPGQKFMDSADAGKGRLNRLVFHSPTLT